MKTLIATTVFATLLATSFSSKADTAIHPLTTDQCVFAISYATNYVPRGYQPTLNSNKSLSAKCDYINGTPWLLEDMTKILQHMNDDGKFIPGFWYMCLNRDDAKHFANGVHVTKCDKLDTKPTNGRASYTAFSGDIITGDVSYKYYGGNSTLDGAIIIVSPQEVQKWVTKNIKVLKDKAVNGGYITATQYQEVAQSWNSLAEYNKYVPQKNKELFATYKKYWPLFVKVKAASDQKLEEERKARIAEQKQQAEEAAERARHQPLPGMSGEKFAATELKKVNAVAKTNGKQAPGDVCSSIHTEAQRDELDGNYVSFKPMGRRQWPQATIVAYVVVDSQGQPVAVARKSGKWPGSYRQQMARMVSKSAFTSRYTAAVDTQGDTCTSTIEVTYVFGQ